MRKLIKKILRESDDLDWIKDVKPEVYTNQKLWNTRRHILYRVGHVKYGEEKWMTDEVHLICPKRGSESRLIPLKDLQQYIEDGIFQDVTNLSSKDYIMESDEWDWVRDTQPPFLELLKAATEHDDRINVYLHDDGTLDAIRDEEGYRYMSEWDFRHLPDGYDDKTLFDSMINKVEEEIVDLERNYDEDSLASHKDYQDFLHLRNTINKLFFLKRQG